VKLIFNNSTKLLDTNSCPLFHKKQKLVNHPSLSTTNRIWDIEDLVRLGKRTQGCPYYASRQIAESAEVIFSPYNYIIDPVIRKVLEIGLEDSIVILDEGKIYFTFAYLHSKLLLLLAHNIEDASRSAGSFETDEETLDVVMKELDLVIKFGGAQEAHRRMEGVCITHNIYNHYK
jgi:Fanconi anemia group J protein